MLGRIVPSTMPIEGAGLLDFLGSAEAREVLFIEGEDEVGALRKITDQVTYARVNIEDVYALGTEDKYAAICPVACADVQGPADALGLA